MPLLPRVALKAALGKGIWAGPAPGCWDSLADTSEWFPLSENWLAGLVKGTGCSRCPRCPPGSPPAPNLRLGRPGAVPTCLCLIPRVDLHTTLVTGPLAKPPAASLGSWRDQHPHRARGLQSLCSYRSFRLPSGTLLICQDCTLPQECFKESVPRIYLPVSLDTNPTQRPPRPIFRTTKNPLGI